MVGYTMKKYAMFYSWFFLTFFRKYMVLATVRYRARGTIDLSIKENTGSRFLREITTVLTHL